MNSEQNHILTKRFQTTMIGALYEFEKTFGYLWGHDKSENVPLSKKEEEFLDLWEDTRNKILNNGNNQLRKSLSELAKASNKNSKYKYNFYNNNERNL